MQIRKNPPTLRQRLTILTQADALAYFQFDWAATTSEQVVPHNCADGPYFVSLLTGELVKQGAEYIL